MIRPGTLSWFAAHELRLSWRDWMAMIGGGRKRRTMVVLAGVAVFIVGLHGLAYLMLRTYGDLTLPPDRHMLAAITGTVLASWSLMLSQALESVTRTFYARGDLELILTSPAPSARLFAVRIAAMAVAIVGMGLTVTTPFINMAIWLGGARWAGGYGVAVAMGMAALVIALLLTVALFRLIGPRRTRVVSQIAAAVVGAAFAIAVQMAAILSLGASVTQSYEVRASLMEQIGPGQDALFWLPARGVMGDTAAVAALLVGTFVALAVTIRVLAPRFGRIALSTASVTQPASVAARGPSRFRAAKPQAAMRRKEWTLLLRDPWLVSQTLMQLLYLLPAAYLMWRGLRGAGGAPALMAPVLVLAAGQFGGGLAWLAVSGEDAPELIATAPVPTRQVLRAKMEAVLLVVGTIFSPFLTALVVLDRMGALIAAVGITVAGVSSTAIQYWFRTQARRSHFRRRQTSSRIATFAEAIASSGWAVVAALLVTGHWEAVIPAGLVLLLLAAVWRISPARDVRAV